LGWILPSPGGSLLVPTLVVLGIGVVLAGSNWVLACFVPKRRGLWTFTVATGVLTLLASIWTFWFSLPTAMWLDTGASRQAQSALVKLSQEPRTGNGLQINNCWTVETGSIGPLGAPYRECAIATTVVGRPFVDVSFVPLASPEHSLEYTNSGTEAFLDLCYRHLIGLWWMTTWDHSGIGDCPIGYQFHGGP
jgi:hypothetical protein